MAAIGLDFEKPITELERKIEELRNLTSDEKMDLSDEIRSLEHKLEHAKKEIYEKLTPWQRVQIARHPKRPYTLDYVNTIMTGFIELHGDRHFRDDKAIITGFAKIEDKRVCVVGHQKGRDTKENLMRSFGSAHPEGYRKAMRIMYLAEKFGLPILCFIDTPGAYPGIGAEERGQAEAIAFNLREMSNLKVPIMAVVIGEGGSGGALGIGVANKIAVMENAYYSVISPEGCAAILWKERTKAADAADVLKLTAQDLYRMGIIHEVIKEPLGGAHRNPAMAAENVKASILKFLSEYSSVAPAKLIEERYQFFRKIGVFKEPGDKDKKEHAG